MNAKYDWKKYKESRERWKKKASDYTRYYRHLDFYMQKVIESSECLFSMEELREKLFEETGFHFNVGTLKKYLKNCHEEHGSAPLEELYRINPEYFDNVRIKPPRINRPRKKK